MITANQIKYALGAILLVLFGTWKAGCNHVQIQFDDYRLKEQALLTKEITDNETLKAQLEVSKNEAQTRIDALANNVRTQFVRLPATACISEAGPASSPTATGGESLPAKTPDPQAALDRFVGGVESLMLEADTVVNNCRVLQDWAAR